MYKKKTKEQLKEAKRAREKLTNILKIIELGHKAEIENMSVNLIKDRLVKYRKRTGIDIGLAYEITELGVTIFRRK